MKKLYRYLLCAAALCAVLSCKRAEDDAPVPIAFNARSEGMEISTKAGAALKNTSDFLSDGQFAVYGTWTVANGTSANVFTKQVVNRQLVSGDYKWVYDPLRYWQKSGKYVFRAVYPVSANTGSASNGVSMITNYSMSVEDYDLMVANSTERNMSGGDTSPVPLYFRHALAAISFVFQKGSLTSVDYHLNSFELKYLLGVGSLVFTSTAQDAKLDDQWWLAEDFRPASLYSWSGNIAVPAAYSSFPGSANANSDPSTWAEWHCVLPQRVRSSNPDEKPSVRFSSSIRNGNGTYTDPSFTTIELPETYTYVDGSGSHTVNAVWEAGKKYVYYIQIQPSGASIKVYATDWDSYKVSVEDLMF